MRIFLSAVLAIAPVTAFAAELRVENPPLPAKGQVTAVIFLSARCPVSNAYGERLEAIYRDYAPRGVQFLFVNPNVNETDAEIAENARRHGYTFPVYHDRESETAIRLGAATTPEAFVLDRDATVRYHGGIDDALNPARVKTESLRRALDAVMAGRAASPATSKAFGCTIKRPRNTQ